MMSNCKYIMSDVVGAVCDNEATVHDTEETVYNNKATVDNNVATVCHNKATVGDNEGTVCDHNVSEIRDLSKNRDMKTRNDLPVNHEPENEHNELCNVVLVSDSKQEADFAEKEVDMNHVTNNEYQIVEGHDREMYSLFDNGESEIINDPINEREIETNNDPEDKSETRNYPDDESETTSDSDDEFPALNTNFCLGVFKQILGMFDNSADDVSDFSSSEEAQSDTKLPDVFIKLFELCTKFINENLLKNCSYKLPCGLSEAVIRIIKKTLAWLTESDSNEASYKCDFGDIVDMDVFIKLFELCTKFINENLLKNCSYKLPCGLSEAVIQIIKKTLTWLTESDNNDSSYKCDFGDIVMDLLELLIREHGQKANETEKEKSVGNKQRVWIDVIKEFLELQILARFTESDNNKASSKCEIGVIAMGLLELLNSQHEKKAYETEKEWSARVGNMQRVWIDVIKQFVTMQLLELIRDSDHNDANSKCDFGDISNDLLELLNRKHEQKQRGWIDMIDIRELLDFFYQLIGYDNWEHKEKRREQNKKKEKVAHSEGAKDGNMGDGSASALEEAVSDILKDLLTDFVKIFMWMSSDCKKFAPEKAEDVIMWTVDGLCSINDILGELGNEIHSGGKSYERLLEDDILLTYFLKIGQWMFFYLSKTFFCSGFDQQILEAPSYDFNIFKQILKLMHWLNSYEFADFKCDEQPIFVSVCSSIIMSSYEWTDSFFSNINLFIGILTELEPLCKEFTQSLKKFTQWWKTTIQSWKESFRFFKFLTMSYIQILTCLYFLFRILGLPLDLNNVVTEALKAVGKISPYCECFLRNMIHIFVRNMMHDYLSWLFCFFTKPLPFAEKTCTFGNNLFKKVSLLELLCFLNEEKPPTPSEFTELQDIVKKLSDKFKTEYDCDAFEPPTFHSEGHDDSVMGVNADVNGEPGIDSRYKDGSDARSDSDDGIDGANADCESKSILDQLWMRYQDTLLGSNWCNIVTHALFASDNFKRRFAFHDTMDPQYLNGTTVFPPTLSGSRLDGCISLLPGSDNVSDFDVMWPKFRSIYYIMEYVADRPLSIVFKTRLKRSKLGNDFDLVENGYLNPLQCKYINSLGLQIFCWLFSVLSPCSGQYKIASSLQEGEAATTLLMFKDEDVIFSLDLLDAVNIAPWPEQARSWVNRKSMWPNREVRVDIAKNVCHAVPKTPKGGDPQKEWRLSFSKAENTLCKMFTPSQAFHLSLLKTQFQSVKTKIGCSKVRIFKNYKITKGEFHTYHAKTTMFWFCENHPPKHDIWRKANAFQCQFELLEFMEGMMREGNIPHYFIPKQNILDGISAKLIQQAVEELKVLKREARTENARVYQEILKPIPQEDITLSQIILNNLLFRCISKSPSGIQKLAKL